MKIGNASIGRLKSPAFTRRLPSAVNSNGAVSPAARATASITPVRIPGMAVRMTTEITVRQVGTPSASAASRSEPGTSRRISSVVRMITGIIRTPSATLPANALNCRNGSTRNVKTKIPTRIDGTPTRTSAAKRIARADLRSANSLTYSPAKRPIGTAIRVASATIWSVPRIADSAPPPVPSARGGFVNRSRLSAAMPLRTTNSTIAASGTMHTTDAATQSARKNRSTSARRRSSPERSSGWTAGRPVAGVAVIRSLRGDRAGDPADEQSGDDVEQQRHHQEDEPEGDEARRLEPDGRLVERRRDLRRDRLRLVEDRIRKVGAVADDHRHGHGLAECATQAEDDRADDPRPGIRHDGPGHRLPARRAQREHRLALAHRDRDDHLP